MLFLCYVNVLAEQIHSTFSDLPILFSTGQLSRAIKMNSIIKKMLLVSFALLLSACVHYPQQYSYYSGYGSYGGGYIMHRNHYGERPYYYDNGYGRGNAYFSPHYRHDHHFSEENGRHNNFGRRNHY